MTRHGWNQPPHWWSSEGVRARPVAIGVALAVAAATGAAALVPARGEDAPKRCPKGAAARKPPASRPASSLSGIFWQKGPRLAELDPLTLEPSVTSLARVSPVGDLSPDGRSFASAREGKHSGPRIRLVDLKGLSVADEISLGVGGRYVFSIEWLSDDRIVATTLDPATAIVVDVASSEVIARAPLEGGDVFDAAGYTGGVVVLTAGPGTNGAEPVITPVTLHRIDASGDVSSLTLEARAGRDGMRQRFPGFAVDPEGGAAFVAEEEAVTEVDLTRMEATVHDLTPSPSLLGQVWSALVGSAAAKTSSGPVRDAVYLPSGHLVVTGEDWDGGRSSIGLLMIDTEDWDACVLHPEMNDAEVAGNALIAWDSVVRLGEGREIRRSTSSGVTGYDLDGKLTFEILEGIAVCGVDSSPEHLYVYACGHGHWVVDTATGKIIAHARNRMMVELVTRERRML